MDSNHLLASYYFYLFFKIWAYPALFFVYFHPFHITNQLQIEKSVDGVLWIRTQVRTMVGADKTTELWRPPKTNVYLSKTHGAGVINKL